MEVLLCELRKKIIDILKNANISASSFEADIFVEHFSGYSKLDILTDRDIKISNILADKIINAATLRANNIPLQHIIGYTEFMGLKFNVNQNVLCPRPDTEILVHETIDVAKKLQCNQNVKLNILDMCTGSGAIAVALAHFLKNASIYAIDISEAALTVAKENAKANRCDVTFWGGDYFDAVANTDINKFDIIVSNPPYIPTADIDNLTDDVRLHEPMLALDGGTDGLTAYKKLTELAPNYLTEGGYLMFEVGINQSNDVSFLMKKDFKDIKIVRDYGGIERVIYGKLI